MCIDISVSLPLVNKFLLFYSLEWGTSLIMYWTAVRTFICVLFITIVIPEVLTGGKDSFSQFPLVNSMAPSTEPVYCVYLNYIVMLVTEAVLFAFSIYDLLSGVCHLKSDRMRQFLICRLFLWIFELAILFVLSVTHGVLIGWYLIILMFIILEFYGIVVVYSYYHGLMDEENVCRVKTWDESEI